MRHTHTHIYIYNIYIYKHTHIYPFIVNLPMKNVIFHSYVSLSEGKTHPSLLVDGL